ncbi:MAG: hypothetical protein WCG62_07410 [Actinomycetes bacterium]
MAKSNSGKWVSRVGAAGGGKAYQKSRPINYYGALTLIVVLGLLSVVYSRYEYQNPASAVAPAIGTTWYAAFSGEACGTTMPALAADAATASSGFTVTQNNVFVISPKVAEEAGRNATLAKFLAQHPKLSYANNTVKFPVPTEWITSPAEYKDGSKCPSGSKYAGQVGHFGIAYWTQFSQKSPIITTDPASIKFTDLMRITFFFEPDGVKPSAPATATLAYMVQLQQATNGSGTTTSTTVR